MQEQKMNFKSCKVCKWYDCYIHWDWFSYSDTRSENPCHNGNQNGNCVNHVYKHWWRKLWELR